ncbi:SpoIIE family protein phosphatase [Streptomyces sp. NPDC007084]|uniref:ATP-binding SpoIIE family protein phosphatase n=1 Tax=Streptomyces sp. NPDC007084 TaxID=3154313 RepID=UPI00345223DD
MTGEAPLMVVDGAGVVVRWSPRARELWRLPDSAALGRTALHLLTRAGDDPAGPAEPGSGPSGIEDHEGNPVDLRVRPVPLPGGGTAWGVFEATGDTSVTGPQDEAADTRNAVLDALRANTRDAYFVVDAELRVLSLNDPAVTLCAATEDEARGRPVGEVCRPSRPLEFDSILRDVVTAGTPVTDYVVRLDPASGSGPERFVRISAFPLREGRGAVLSLVEVTEHMRTERRIEALASVRERVGRSLDVVTTCEELVDALVPGFADIAVVEVVDAVVRGEDPPLSPLGREVPLRRAAFRNAVSDRAAQAHPLGDVRALPTPTPYSQALTDLKPRAVTLDEDTPWLAADPQRARAIRDSGARTLLTAPLAVRGSVLGLLSLYRVRGSDAFDANDVALTHELATHTALSLDNARRYTHEHTIAAALQRHLLPPDPPSQTAMEFAQLHLPADAGAGTWFDAFSLPGARTALTVGEVRGTGIDAATTMGQLRTVVRSLAALDLEPDELLARLNDTVVRLAYERQALPTGDPLHQEPLSASCVYVVHDPLHGVCAMASAGHPAPVVAHPSGVIDVPELPAGPLLGSRHGPPFATASVPMRDGSVLALWTTSFPASESRGRRPSRLLREALSRLDRPLAELRDDILYRLRGTPGTHDVLLLLARTREFPADQVATWPLDPVPAAAGTARQHARHRLRTWQVSEETAFATELIVSELVTNAVRYGSPPIRLRLIKDSTLTCEVSDGGGAAPRIRHARTVDEGGRGLFICQEMSHNWGIRYSAEGKTIWTEQPLP